MPARILIVDDEPFIRSLIRDSLETKDYETGLAANGEEALDELARCRYDLVISDVVMPEMEGLELLKRIRKGYPGLRVIILTGFSREHGISDFLLCGANEYLTKPFQITELLDTVEKVLEE